MDMNGNPNGGRMGGARHAPWRRRGTIGLVVFALAAAVGLPASAVRAATDQTISFTAPWTGSVGDSIALTASATSGLAISYASADTSICSVTGATLTFVAPGTCSVTASQAGDGTYGPAPDVTVAIRSALGYHAVATASRGGVDRTDGTIQVGDTLVVTVTAFNTIVEGCLIRITTAGGWLMTVNGATHPDGSCDLTTVVPQPSDAAGRAAAPSRDDLDLCISIEQVALSDSSTRVMDSPDRLGPGGFACYNGADRSQRQDEVLDFSFAGTGTPAPFTSVPNMLSWNIADWDPSYVPLQFNTNWHVAFPAWVTTCQAPYLNGSWDTSFHFANQPGPCQDWDLRLPGVLPNAMPWGGGPGAWNAEFVLAYTNDVGGFGETITTQDVPYEPSDGVFQASLPAIAPTDLAADRFVDVGNPWLPSFQIAGVSQATSCSIYLLTAPGNWGNPISGTIGPSGLACTFALPAYSAVDENQQYWVTFGSAGLSEGYATYGGTITAISQPTPPTIPDPTDNGDGTTTVGADPGAGQGMSVALDLGAGPNAAPAVARAVKASVSACSAVSYTTTIASGGGLSPVTATCPLAPGAYVESASMVDASGKVTTSSLPFTVLPNPATTYHTLSPARILDTRFGTGVSGSFRSGIAQEFAVTGHGGVPLGAVAVTGNLTVTGQTGAGYVSLTRSAQSHPTTSTINFPLADSRANGVTVGLTSDGHLWATYVSASSAARAHLLFDVTGYFTADAAGATYHTVTPGRILNTVASTGLTGRFLSAVPREFAVIGQGGVPASAVAVTGTLTVTGQTGPGYVSLTTSAQSHPATSVLNFPIHDNRANGVTLRLDASGGLWATYVAGSSSASTNLIFDVTGYFTADATGASYHSLAAGRIFDTRTAKGLSSPFTSTIPRQITVAGVGAVPAGAIAVTGNLTVAGQTQAGYVSLTSTSQAHPATSTLNFPWGDSRATGVTTPLGGSGELWATYVGTSPTATANLIFDLTGYFAP